MISCGVCFADLFKSIAEGNTSTYHFSLITYHFSSPARRGRILTSRNLQYGTHKCVPYRTPLSLRGPTGRGNPFPGRFTNRPYTPLQQFPSGSAPMTPRLTAAPILSKKSPHFLSLFSRIFLTFSPTNRHIYPHSHPISQLFPPPLQKTLSLFSHPHPTSAPKPPSLLCHCEARSAVAIRAKPSPGTRRWHGASRDG